MQTHIRVFTPNDYPAVVDIFNVSWHDLPTTVEQLHQQDEAAQRHPDARFQRYVVEHDGDIIAFGHYDQPLRFYKPLRFRINIFVHPQYQRQGVGTRLYEYILEDLQALNVHSLWVKIREDMSDAVQFVQKYDFQEDLHVWELCLEDVAAFDPTPFEGLNTTLAAQRITVKTLRELEADDACYQKLYQLTCEICQDLPAAEQLTQLSYDDFLQDTQAHSSESYFVAVHEGSYIGVSYLIDHKEGYCMTGLTGVKGEYRLQGIALLLKLQGIAYAKEHECSTIRTSLVSANIPSLSMNERLGFVKYATWIVFGKTFTSQ